MSQTKWNLTWNELVLIHNESQLEVPCSIPFLLKGFGFSQNYWGNLSHFLCISFGGVFTFLCEKFHGSCWCFNLKGTITKRNIFIKKDSIIGDNNYFYLINLAL